MNGALVQPAQLVFGLADKLPKNVELYENSPVIDIRKGKINTLRTPESTIRAENVIMACNYEPLASGQQKQRVVGVTLSGSITRVLTQDEIETLGTETSWGVLSLHSGGATVRLTDDKRISIRNTAEYNNHRLLNKGQLRQDKKFTVSHLIIDFQISATCHLSTYILVLKESPLIKQISLKGCRLTSILLVAIMALALLRGQLLD